MRAHGDRRQRWVLARPAREHIAHVVDRDGAAERLALRLEPIAHLSVEVGQSQAANAAFRRRADLRGLHQAIPKPLGVDLEVLQGESSRWPRQRQGGARSSPDFALEPSGSRRRQFRGSEARTAMGRWCFAAGICRCSRRRGGERSCPIAAADRARDGGDPRLRDQKPGRSGCGRAAMPVQAGSGAVHRPGGQ